MSLNPIATLDKKTDAYSMLPENQLMGMENQGIQSLRRGVPPQMLELMAVQAAIKTKNAHKNNLLAAEQQNPQTIKAQKENELLQMEREGLGLGPSQQEMAQGVAGALQNKQAKANKNMQALSKIDPRMLQALAKRRGIAGAPVPRVQTAAQGGIVGYKKGGEIPGYWGAGLVAALPYAAPVAAGVARFGRPIWQGIKGGGNPKNWFTKPRTVDRVTKGELGDAAKSLGYGNLKTNTKGQPMHWSRAFSPKRTAITGGTALGLLGLLGDDEPQTEEQTTKQTDADPKPTPKDRTDTGPSLKIDREAEAKDRDKAFRRLMYVLSTKGGFQNLARADAQFYQKELNNELAELKLDIDADAAKATTLLAQTKAEELDYSKLMTRMSAIQGQINDITKDVMNSPLGMTYDSLLNDLQADPTNEGLRAEVEAQKKLIEAAIINRAQAFQSEGGVGLFGQLKALQKMLYLQDIDTTQAPKVVDS